MTEVKLFEARNLVHQRIKSTSGFLGIHVDSKAGIYGNIVILVNSQYSKESLHRILGDQQYGHYIKYIVKGGLEFL